MDPAVYIRESCEMQNATTPGDFIGMARAYEWAIWRIYAERRPLTIHILSDLITYIREAPWVNFRSQPAVFANGRIIDLCGDDAIKRQLNLLFDAWNDGGINPTELYWRFEEIHPWDDGNGRVGSLLYNLAAETIGFPEHPSPDPIWSR